MSKKSPQLRFEGFTDDWEQRKLGEIFNYEQPTKYIVKSTEYDDTFNTPVLTAGKSFLLGYTDEITGIKNATVDNPVVIFDDFTTGSHYVDFPFKIKSSAMKLLSLNDNSDNFYFMFNTLKNIKYVPQSHERHWISKFSEFEIYKPSQEEQEKIGSFFKQLDETIALHQRKLDLLIEQKKGFLQKMFPKHGEKVPELRFAGFADDWEERKFGEVWKKSSERNLNLEYSPKQVLSVAQMKLNPSNRNEQDDYMKTYNVLHKGDIAFEGNKSKSFAFGRFVLNDLQDGIVSHVFNVYRPICKMDTDFMKVYINNESVMKYLLVKATTKTLMMTTLNTKDIVKQKLNLPSLEEQQKIGSFFKQLDDTIALHQRKLDLLKEQKKGFLQKMFV